MVRRAIAWGATLAFALAFPGAILDFLLIFAHTKHVQPALATCLAGVSLSIWLGFAGGPPLAALAALAERLGKSRSWMHWLWPVPITAVQVAAAWFTTDLTRKMHPGPHLLMIAGFTLVVVLAAEIKHGRHRIMAVFAAAIPAGICVYLDLWIPGTLYRDLHDVASVAASCMVLTLAGPIRWRIMKAPRRDALLMVGLMLVSASVLSRTVDRYSPGWQSIAGLYARNAPRMARFLRSLVDLDGDGFSPVAWGTDCDDLDPDKNPLAHDRPGGGDRNCNGIDPPAHPTDEQRGLTEPFGSPDLAPDQVDLVLLITIDTMRADAFRAEVTPRLHALAARGITLTSVYAAGARTRLSLPPLNESAPGSKISLARRIERAGVTTTAVFSLSDAQLVPSTRDYRHVDRPESGEWPAEKITELALADLRAHKERHFLWIHYIDAHYPYEMHRGTAPVLKPDDRQVEFPRYLHELTLVDGQLGRVLDEIEAEGRTARTAFVVTSDHGEGFGEHGIYFHGTSGFEEIVRVPGVLVAPGVPVGRHTGLTSHRDATATILGLFGLVADTPDAEKFGRSWLRLREAVNRPLHRFVVTHSARYAAGDETQSPMALISEGSLRLSLSFDTGLEELYDIAADPDERQEISPDEPEATQRLRQHLEMYRDLESWP